MGFLGKLKDKIVGNNIRPDTWQEHGNILGGLFDNLKWRLRNGFWYGDKLLDGILKDNREHATIQSYRELISFNFSHETFIDLFRTPVILFCTRYINSMIMSKYDIDISSDMEIQDFVVNYIMLLWLNAVAILFVREKIFDYVWVGKDFLNKKIAKAQRKLKWDIVTDIPAGLWLLYANYTQDIMWLGIVLALRWVTEYVEGKRFPEDGGMLSKLRGMWLDKVVVISGLVWSALLVYNTKINLYNMARYFAECEKTEIPKIKTRTTDWKTGRARIYTELSQSQLVSISESIETWYNQYMYIITVKNTKWVEKNWYIYTAEGDNYDYTSEEILIWLQEWRYTIYQTKHPTRKVPDNQSAIMVQLESGLFE